MIDETVQLEDDEELEEEAEAEVDKVLFEVTDGKLGQAGSVGTELPVCLNCLPQKSGLPVPQAVQTDAEEEEERRQMEQYREQLNGLLSG
jgi:charged multivesicular body protein 3